MRKWPQSSNKSLFTMLIGLSLGFSAALSAQWQGRRPYLTLASHNDNWGGGFTQWKDDLRSFGLSAEFQAPLYGQRMSQGRLSWNGFTNRYDPDSSRLDEWRLSLRLPVYTFFERIHLDATVELGLAGNYGGEQVQNQLHDWASSRPVNLPYSQDTRFFALGGAKLWSEQLLRQFSGSLQLDLLPIVGGQVGPEALYSYEAALLLRLQNAYADQVSLGIGYQQASLFPDPTYAAVLRAENAAYVHYAMRLGALHYEMKVFPAGNFSYGNLGINLLNVKGRERVEELDCEVELGWFSKAQGFFIRQLWRDITLGYDRLFLDVHYQSWELRKSRLLDYPNRLGHFHQISLGAYYEPIAPKDRWQILPFISARVGYKEERAYGDAEDLPVLLVSSMPLIGEAGLKLKLPAVFLHKTCYYGLMANYQYVYHAWKDPAANNSGLYTFAENLGYYGAGGFLMIDL